MPVYLVRTHLPDTRVDDVRAAIARVSTAVRQLGQEGFRIRCLTSTYIPVDGWLGCLYEADSPAEVELATERAVMPFDDIVDAVHFGASADNHRDGDTHAQ
jgi:hypothetical protein